MAAQQTAPPQPAAFAASHFTACTGGDTASTACAGARAGRAEQRLPGRQQPSFRAGIDIVSLNVCVTNAANHYVTDLAEGDFSVFEDGVKQNITFFLAAAAADCDVAAPRQ